MVVPNGPTTPNSQADDGTSPNDVRQAVNKQSDGPGPPPVVQPCPSAKTWVEFCLLDMEGNPVSGQRYRATLTDGSKPEGRTPKSGCVRFDGIPSGTATIAYLDLDEEAWERI
jgi:hypothetical protein